MNAKFAHKTRLFPDEAQAKWLRQCFGAARFAYNWALREMGQAYEAGEKLNADQADKRFNAWKATEARWLYDSPSCVAQQAIKKHLKCAFDRFFKGLGKYPKPHRRGSLSSAEFTNVVIMPRHISAGRVTLPGKMGTARIGDMPPEFTKLNCTTISETGGRFYISFQIEGDIDRKPATGPMVGVDVGVKVFAAISDGRMLPERDDYDEKIRRIEVHIEDLQRKLAYKTYIASNGRQCFNKSNNVRKLRDQIGKLNHRIKLIREARAHAVSAKLARDHIAVAAEDLSIKNMTGSASGTIDEPGTGVAAKSGLNRAMLRQGVADLYRQLDYKCGWHGGQFIQVDPRYTSQTCPSCGHTAKENRPERARFECADCGFTGHADTVAAINIAARAAA